MIEQLNVLKTDQLLVMNTNNHFCCSTDWRDIITQPTNQTVDSWCANDFPLQKHRPLPSLTL
jgi:hypothetical protein